MSRSWAGRRRSAAISRSKAPTSSRSALASGKLPVKLNVVEERTVSAELGSGLDQEAGTIASIFATLAVIGLMVVTYGRFGVYASIALLVNALMILGIMAVFNATLTLPGHRRLRSNDRRGGRRQRADQRAHPRGAAGEGGECSTRWKPATAKASTTIFDANITNTIAAR